MSLFLVFFACSAPSSMDAAAPAPVAASAAPAGAEPTAHSHVYAGHASQIDPKNLLAVWPQLAGTRLDDCRTCHRGWPGTSGELDTCDGCHLLHHPPAPGDPPAPASVAETLNPFGRAYLAAGRTVAALRAVADDDSDGDGADNQTELSARTFPGDPASRPGQHPAPVHTFTASDLQALPRSSAFVLVNPSKDPEDVYSDYEGVRLIDLLAAAGVDTAAPGPEGVTLFAPDGYAHTLPWAAVAQPGSPVGVERGLDKATLGEKCGWVRYPAKVPETLGAPWVLLAWLRDGQPVEAGRWDEDGRLRGEGPYRLVVPNAPGERPDRGARSSPSGCGDGRDYDPGAPHNAGAMVRTVVAVRVDPMPTDVDPPDLAAMRANLEQATVSVFGFGVHDDHNDRSKP